MQLEPTDFRPEADSLLLNALRRDSFTSVLDDLDLRQIAQKMEVRQVSGVLFEEGAAADLVFVLQEGCLDVSTCGRHLHVLGRGTCAGTFGVLRKVYLHTLTTLPGSSATVWSTNTEYIRRLLDQWCARHDAENRILAGTLIWMLTHAFFGCKVRKLIDRIHLFDFLPEKQKARLSELPVRVQVPFGPRGRENFPKFLQVRMRC
ncbi:unnamed protein product [Durusdinium trenchii]|uniref:Cyclic nucleotide-binding domain-containing protein n=1 Tax=Durusdinium trenchii TaxID=1381693 RepID=A0ABP0PKL5_9DINO